MANIVDPDQTATEAVWSGSSMSSEASLFQYLEYVWYLYSGYSMAQWRTVNRQCRLYETASVSSLSLQWLLRYCEYSREEGVIGLI